MEKFDSGPLKGYKLVGKNDQVKNRAFKGPYYTNGKSNISYKIGRDIINGKRKKLDVLKKYREKAKNPPKKYINPSLSISPDFKLIKSTDKSVKNRIFKSSYFTNGEISFTQDQAKRYANNEISWNELILYPLGGQKFQRKEVRSKGGETFRFLGDSIENALLFLKYQISDYKYAYIVMQVRLKRDSIPSTKKVWVSPLVAAFADSAKTEQYRKRIRMNIAQMNILEIIKVDVVLYNRNV